MDCCFCDNKLPQGDYGWFCSNCIEIKKQIFSNSVPESEKYSSHKLKITYNVEDIDEDLDCDKIKARYYQNKKIFPLIKKFTRDDFDEMGWIKSLENPLLYFYGIDTKVDEQKPTKWVDRYMRYSTIYEIIGVKLVKIPDADMYVLH